MRQAEVRLYDIPAGILEEIERNRKYRFVYLPNYAGPPVSLTLPVDAGPFNFDRFPPFFDGLLPEGPQLEALLRLRKLDRNDLFGQLMAIGKDMVGAVTVMPLKKDQ